MRSTVATAALLALAGPADAQQPWVERANVDSAGAQSGGLADAPALSADGRFLAFTSRAADLVPGDTNGAHDVFVRDRLLGTTERVSVATLTGVQSDGDSDHAGISADGRYVVFASTATNLSASFDFNGASDVFVRDRQAGTTVLVSVVPPSQPQAGFSGSGSSYAPAISADGRWVVFYSGASDLLAPGVDTNGFPDAFVADLQTAAIVRISLGPGGAQTNWFTGQGPGMPGTTAISADGRVALFLSEADNLVPGAISGAPTIYVRDLAAGTTDVVARTLSGSPSIRSSDYPALSADGRFAVFSSSDPALVPGDTNSFSDYFVRDLQLGTTERVTLDSLGREDTWIGPPVLLLDPRPAISADGRRVAFEGAYRDLVPGDTNGRGDVFVHDRLTGATQMISHGLGGVPANASSAHPALSASGDVVAFQSMASNLVPGDTNSGSDVFVARLPDTPATFCAGDGSAAACPCGNVGAAGHGCGSSIEPGGARLVATGVPSVSADSTAFLAAGLPPLTVVSFVQGSERQLGGQGSPFGDGLRCVAGTIHRLGTRTANAGGGISFGANVGSDPRVSVQGQVPAPGATRTYQAYYRNAQTFCTASTFNLSNGVEIVWLP